MEVSPGTTSQLMPQVYNELRALARAGHPFRDRRAGRCGRGNPKPGYRVLEIPEHTAVRRWDAARVRIFRRLNDEASA